ncbi:MAG: hypothetical protein BAJALOKI3v1_1140001, partial [Promethearchaeota archaeon]
MKLKSGMTQKGKYQILSYFIDDDLIFYKSINRNKKLIAFSLLKVKSLSEILQKLLDLLLNDMVSYFSFQIDVYQAKILIFCIESMNRANIKNLFKIIKKKLISNNSIEILNGKELEKHYTNILDYTIDPDARLKKNNEKTLILENNEKNVKIKYFKLNLTSVPQKESFITSFTKMLENFKMRARIVFSFKINKNYQIILTAYLIILIEKEEKINSFLKEVNNFYENLLLSGEELDLGDLAYILWRLPVIDSYFDFNDLSSFFNDDYKSKYIKISSYLVDKCRENGIPSLRINENMILVNKKILFIMNIQ